MRTIKWLLISVLVALLLVDGIVAFRLIRYGWPKRLVENVVGSAAQVQAVPMQMTSADWAFLFAYVLLHAFVCYGVWRVSRRSSGGAVHL
jgi:hypothetical protein